MRSLSKKIFNHPLFFPIIITVIYFAINLVLVLNHEHWRDEANPWQIAKSLNFNNFFEVMQVEPHPILWFLIIMPFAKLGFPYVTTSIISLLIMTLAVFLFSRYAPFSKTAKILVALSAVFFYFNPVISRNYCLVVLSIILVAMAYRNRLAHPIRYALTLALLFQAHFLVAGLAGILTAFFINDYIGCKAKNIRNLVASLGVICASVALSLPMIIGSLKGHSVIEESIGASIFSVDWLLELNLSLFGTVIPLFEIIVILVIASLYFRYPKQLIIFVFATLAQMSILIFAYNMGAFQTQKSVLIVAFALFAFWIAHYEKPRKQNKLIKKINNLEIIKPLSRLPAVTPLIILIIATIPHALTSAYGDLTGDYSYSVQVAQYINESIPENSVILVADNTSAGTAITFVPLLEGNRRFFDVATNSFIDYYKFDGYPELTDSDIIKTIEEFPSTNIYYMTYGTACGPGGTVDDSWTLKETFEANPDTQEPQLKFYHIASSLPAVNVDQQNVDSIFSVESIPRIDITTSRELDLSYKTWNEGITATISDNAIEKNNYAGLSGKIRTRGNTTYEAGRKYGPYQYKIKFDKKVDLFGFGEHKDWILLANFLDRSYLRQFFLSGVGQLVMGEDYFVPQMKYAELYINNEYKGLYLIAESIEENENRLNIKIEKETTQTEIPFLVQMENGRMPRAQGDWYDHSSFFMIDDQATPCIEYEWLEGAETTDTMISMEYPKSTKDITATQANYIKSTVENLYKDTREGVPFYDLDINHESFVSYFAFQEIMFNSGFGSSSVFYYKPIDGKITAGPLWDFDQLLMMDIGSGLNLPPTCDNNLYRYLLAYPEFRSLLYEKIEWFGEVLAPHIKEQLAKLQGNQTLRAAVERNELKYQTWGRRFGDLSVYQNQNIVNLTSWDEHINYIQEALSVRTNIVLKELNSL